MPPTVRSQAKLTRIALGALAVLFPVSVGGAAFAQSPPTSSNPPNTANPGGGGGGGQGNKGPAGQEGTSGP
jgi:hypothetical protein